MDISASLAPRSDQLNADDMISGPMTVTIAAVIAGKAEQPFDFQLVEYPGRAYRPSLSMRRMIVQAWGKEASEYTARQMTLFRNPEITFGPTKVGGIQISHLSHIAGPVSLPLTITRGKRKDFTIQPRPYDLSTITDIAAITELGKAATGHADTETIDAIRARYNELKKG